MERKAGRRAATPSPAERAETLAGSPSGTPNYMSPEQAAGRIDLLGTRTDIYSLAPRFIACSRAVLPSPKRI